jgi:putative ABC transport system permease protein
VIIYLAEQLKRRRGRAVVIGAGVLLASVSFVLLTASTRTSVVQVRGEVMTQLRPAYDLLVRPPGTESSIERRDGLIRNNFETGVIGGITTKQLATIRNLPGVGVAAPVEYLGWVSLEVGLPFTPGPYMKPDTLYRETETYTANSRSKYSLGAVDYLYYANTPGGCDHMLVYPPPATHLLAQAPFLLCYSRGHQYNHVANINQIQTGAQLYFPLLIAAVDPTAENQLLGLNESVVSGSPLSGGDGVTRYKGAPVVPVLASTVSYLSDSVKLNLQEVRRPAGRSWERLLSDPTPPPPNGGPNKGYRVVQALPARTVHSFRVNKADAYQHLLHELAQPGDPLRGTGVFVYWTAGSVNYGVDGNGSLAAKTVINPDSVWREFAQGLQPYAGVPPDIADTAYRAIAPARYTGRGLGPTNALQLRVVGRFDPRRLAQREPLNQVPLETYQPPLVRPGNPATRAALNGRPLAPTANIAGYVAQPPYLITSLKGAQALLDPKYFRGPDNKPLPNATAPISVIRVKIASLSGSPTERLNQIKSVAKLITDKTGLLVDVAAGSSPAPQTVHLPPGRFGMPLLTLREDWAKKGVAIVILQAIDRRSVTLFGLILLVTALFLVNAGITAIRARRTEIGVLSCLGWTPRHIFAVTIGESAFVGLAAGVLGTAVSAAIVAGADLAIPYTRLIFVPPTAVVLTVAAGLPAAIRAARQRPIDAMSPAVLGGRRRRYGFGRFALIRANVLSRPGRTLMAALAVAVAVAALTTLAAITDAFGGTVAGSLLGNYVTVEVHGADWAAAGLTLGLSSGFIADLLLLSVRERTDDLLVLRSTGWAARHTIQILLVEAMITAGLGALVGAAGGLVIGLELGTALGATLGVAVAAIAVAMLATVLAASAPAIAAMRVPVTALGGDH